MDAALRAYLSKYKIDEASLLRVYFKLKIVFNGIKIKNDDDLAAVGQKVIKCENYKIPVEEDLEKWGVEIDSMVVTDIVLPDTIKELRRKVLEASKEAEATEFTAKKTVTLAKGEKKAFVEIGDGIGKQIKKMVFAKHAKENGPLKFERVVPDNNVQLFASDGTPLLWYHKYSNGGLEFFAQSGKHPQLGIELLPVDKEIAMLLRKYLAEGKYRSEEHTSELQSH